MDNPSVEEEDAVEDDEEYDGTDEEDSAPPLHDMHSADLAPQPPPWKRVRGFGHLLGILRPQLLSP